MALSSAALPAFGEVPAAPDWSVVDFISDLHLSEDTPRAFATWAQWMRGSQAHALFILGDLFETWVGDDARHAGFEALCSQVIAAAASQRFVALMVGNRDFLIGREFMTDCGVHLLTDPTVLAIAGERLLLSHGDELCIGDVEYQHFRRLVRSEAWQRDFLSKPLSSRRRQARQMRAQSAAHHKSRPAGQWFDVDPATAVRWMEAAKTPVLIHGHTHRPATEALAPGYVRHVLSDWDLDQAPVPRAEALRWQAGALVRIPIIP